MKTVFKVGIKVYDQLVFPDKEGKVIRVVESDDYPIKVHYKGLGINELSYTTDGRYYTDIKPTLATKPYIFEGFEQKALVPTFEEAWTGTDRIYEPKSEYDKEEFGGYPSQELANAAEALRRLLFLRDYYNEGWQPDWSKKNKMHFCIRVRNNEITAASDSDINEFNAVLVFEDYTIRDKFFKEQKELLEIAKPLL
jgi:hypothetical protein